MTTSKDFNSVASIKAFASELFAAFPAHFAMLIVCSFVLSLCEGIGLFLVLPLIALTDFGDRNPIEGNWTAKVQSAFAAFGIPLTLYSVLLLFLALIAAHSCMQLIKMRLAADLQSRYVEHLRNTLYRKILSCNWLFFTRSRAGELLAALTSRVDEVAVAAYYAMELLVGILVMVTYCYISFRISAAFSAVAVVCAIAILFVLRKKVLMNAAIGKNYSAEISQLFDSAQDFLESVKVTKAIGREDAAFTRFASHTQQLRGYVRTASKNSAALQAASQMLAAAILAGLLLIAVKGLGIGFEMLTLFALIFARVTPRLTGLQSQAQNLLQIMPAWEMLAQLSRACDSAAESAPRAAATPLAGDISVHGVSFSYPGSADPVLSDAEVLIAAGKITAFIGHSGAGKTTLADLCMGLLTPSVGVVKVGGLPIDEQTVSSWRQQISYVPQDGVLISQSIRENLAWHAERVGEEAIWSTLEDVHLFDLVKQLPLGLDTPLGDHGVRLSAGERQRLAIACALVRKPHFLVLDEATNCLDAALERDILRMLRDKYSTTTVLLITHRTAPLEYADTVFEVGNRQVVKQDAAISGEPAPTPDSKITSKQS